MGEVRYLDGGLFLPHKVEISQPDIHIPDAAFEEIFDLFEGYSWNLNDTPGGDDNEINPDVLGYIFERYINQKQFGAYYTRPEITRYLCEKAIHPLILERVNAVSQERPFESIEEMLLRLNPYLCRMLWAEILPQISILDPACGSGAFLVAALKTLIDVYAVVLGKAKLTSDSFLQRELRKIEQEHPSIYYWIKKRIITDNLFGVDIMEEATEIAKLRLFLTLVASATRVEDLEPLPNIDFNILAGNSLIGLLHVKEEDFDSRNLFRRSFRQVLAEKNRRIDAYRHAGSYADKLQALRDEIEEEKRRAVETLNEILMEEFKRLGIKCEEATWDEKTGKEGKAKKRPLKIEDIDFLQPFHWAYEFDQVLQHGGFDVVLTNPPWEVFKPQAKEFFAEHSDIVTKKKMTIKDFEKEQVRLLRRPEIRAEWLRYQSRFPHVSLFYRNSRDYLHQAAVVDGKKTGSDINLYKLFLERCFRLAGQGGRCGILLPTSIYSDLGAKGLREMLFEECRVEALFGFSNERYIFEGVHHSFRICLVVFEKGVSTESFEAAFRINPREAISVERLELFLRDASEHLEVHWAFVQRLFPDSLSIMEFRSEKDIEVVEKMIQFPRLGEKPVHKWNPVLGTEFHMTNDSHLFETFPAPGRLPLFTGRMFNQFCLTGESSGYWIDEKLGRAALLGGPEEDVGQVLDYQGYRWVHRRIARSTDSRTMISMIAPPNVFTEVNSTTIRVSESGISEAEMVYLCAVANSFVFDWFLRQMVSSTLNMFYVYQVPLPRLTESDAEFQPIVDRAARLICTSDVYAALWEKVMGGPWSADLVAIDVSERFCVRAELDGLVALLYRLTKDDFAHILTTFPVVPEAMKNAALAAYREFAPRPGDPEILALLAQGESAQLEFKSTVWWDLREQRKNPVLGGVIVHTVAAFLNANGGTLLIGVADDGTIVGLEPDYRTLKNKRNRDGFELALTDLLLNALGRDLATAMRISFHEVDSKEVCRILVSASPRPVFLKEGNEEVFWLRAGNSTRKLSLKEAVEYCKAHWR